MRGIGPAAAVAGTIVLFGVAGGLWRLLWLRTVMIGFAGGPLLHSRGFGADGDGWGSWILLPLLGGLLLALVALAATRIPLVGRAGPALLGLAGVALVLEAGLLGALGLGTLLDAHAPGSLVVLAYPHVSGWTIWGRWIADGGTLLAIALLLGFGPRGPSARRAVLALLLALGADHAWRVAVTLLSGTVPFVTEGLGPLEQVAMVVWLLFGLLAVAFVGIVANLPDADGPRPRSLLALIALGGLVLGFEGAVLYGLGLLHALGLETWVELPMPLWHGMLATLRFGLVLAGSIAVGLGLLREPEQHTSAPHG